YRAPRGDGCLWPRRSFGPRAPAARSRRVAWARVGGDEPSRALPRGRRANGLASPTLPRRSAGRARARLRARASRGRRPRRRRRLDGCGAQEAGRDDGGRDVLGSRARRRTLRIPIVFALVLSTGLAVAASCGGDDETTPPDECSNGCPLVTCPNGL